MDEKSLGTRILEIPYWYHRIELPAGNTTPGFAPLEPEKYAVPDDLTGKRVLDIGAWDGYWTFEALKRGAKEVIAIDDFSDYLGLLQPGQRKKWESFDLCREALGYSEDVCKRYEMNAYDISEETLGRFDIVFFFGMVYHLQHPLLALQKIAAICDGELYIESAILDDYSPYRGGIGKGYPENEMVMEFYPGKQYGCNESNWWSPTLQCLGEMVKSVGFGNIQAWSLTNNPKHLAECRGFVYGSKTGAENQKILKLVDAEVKPKALTVAAVMSVPRLGFQDNSFCIFEGLLPLKIPIIKTTGAFWGQCLERGMQQQIDVGADVLLTIDYDTLFKAEDVKKLYDLMTQHPEIDALVPLQVGRCGMQCLMTVKTKSGMVREIIQRDEFDKDITKIATGHFGLTMIRTSALMKMPHPWLIGQPNSDGLWGPGRIDDDIYFWKQMEKYNLNVYSANRVVLGHLELVGTWPDEDLKPIYQTTADYQTKGKPEKVWK